MKKVFFIFPLFLILYSLFIREANAAFVTINPTGEVVWQVLGTDTSNLKIPAKPELKIKNISNLISLNNTDGKIELNNLDVSNIKEDLVEIEARGNSNNLKISNVEGQFNIAENGLNAKTSFPITIDPVKNELSVETDSGNRLISILPYEATLALIRNKSIDTIKDNTILLKESSKGELEYEINGIKNVNLFNIININAEVNSKVSASNGEVLEMIEPQWLKFAKIVFKS